MSSPDAERSVFREGDGDLSVVRIPAIVNTQIG